MTFRSRPYILCPWDDRPNHSGTRNEKYLCEEKLVLLSLSQYSYFFVVIWNRKENQCYVTCRLWKKWGSWSKISIQAPVVEMKWKPLVASHSGKLYNLREGTAVFHTWDSVGSIFSLQCLNRKPRCQIIYLHAFLSTIMNQLHQEFQPDDKSNLCHITSKHGTNGLWWTCHEGKVNFVGWCRCYQDLILESTSAANTSINSTHWPTKMT